MSDMAISARNRWPGRIEKVTPGAVSAEVAVRLESGDCVHSIVTLNSTERLALEAGKTVHALVKASSVMLSIGAKAPLIGARNRLSGTVVRLCEGPLSAELMLETPGGLVVTAVVSRGSLKRTGVARGGPGFAVFKASGVMLALPGS